jgi:hypothetical protein
MKSILATLIFGIANISIMQMYAKSMLGPTPLSLPLIFSVFSAFMAVRTTKILISNKNNDNLKKTFCLFVWILLIIFNIYQFNSILYVA